jgi:hypothetical protein
MACPTVRSGALAQNILAAIAQTNLFLAVVDLILIVVDLFY